MRNRMLVAALIAVGAMLAPSQGTAASGTSAGGAPTTAKVFRPVGGGQPGLAAPQLSPANLSYDGGQVFTTPSIFLIYWGPEWSSGFSTGGYGSAAAQAYVNSFIGGVGGSLWLNSTTQYCQGISPRLQFCAGLAGARRACDRRARWPGEGPAAERRGRRWQ